MKKKIKGNQDKLDKALNLLDNIEISKNEIVNKLLKMDLFLPNIMSSLVFKITSV